MEQTGGFSFGNFLGGFKNQVEGKFSDFLMKYFLRVKNPCKISHY